MEPQSLLDLIAQAAEEQCKTLNLWGPDLSDLNELPKEIGNLTNLTSLHINGRQLQALPESIGNLTNLTSLHINGRQLQALPESIWNLTNLKSLHINGQQLQALPELIGNLTNLTSLHISGQQLQTLPESIGNLTNLTSLSLLYNRQLQALPESIGNLTNLTSLSLLYNQQLQALPESIGNLTNLTSLSLLHNQQLQALPESIWNLPNLTSLSLYIRHDVLPESIGNLTNLTSLHLDCGYELKALPESIGNLTNLTSLYFNCGYKLKALPESIGNLTNLTSLHVRNYQLKALPESIGNLINLTSLHISDNYKLEVLPESIGNLINLTSLHINSNDRLKALPESIGNLTNLTSLEIICNPRIKALPESTGNLTKLQYLDLTSNKLEILPESIGKLKLLRELKATKNRLISLPKSLSQLKQLSLLTISSNKLDLPPEIARKRKPETILDFLRQQQEEGIDYIYEAKLLIIGEGGAGKTSLANKLIDSNYKLKIEASDNPEKSTEGIDVLRFNFPHSSGNDFRINIWDFGGQEIYHATHQFFLTKRSLYLLVADTRQDNTDFNYWLEVVELLSESSPALIVKNEKQDRPCQVNEKQLRGRFPNLEKVLPTNLSDNRGLPEIFSAIQHHISQLPHIGQPLPKTWVRVRAALETDIRNYITQSEFLSLCDIHGFKRSEDALQLSGYLHDLGVCLHFQDDPILKNIVILKPEWGTDAVYKVLDTKQVNQKLGCFTQADLTEIWVDEQYAQMRDELLQLMKNFKLCYEIPNRPKNYIAPQLLSPNQPEYDWTETDNLILRYHYEFMPKGMLTRFAVEMHRLIDSDLIWKDGVIIADNNARAEVIEVYYKKEIRIRISGKFKKSLLERIRHEFDNIHASYNKPEEPPENHRLRYQEFIPCNCLKCYGSQSPHSYALKSLEERIKKNRDEIECDISYDMVNVRNLIDDAIGNIESVRSTESERRKEYPQEAYEDMRDIAKLAVSRDINITQKQTMIDQSKYSNDLKGANVANFANEVKDTARQQANQNNYAAPSKSLVAAAKEIKDLLNQISATDKTNNHTLIAIQAIESIEKNPTLKDRIINAGKEAGFAALDAAVDHPAVKIVTAAIKGAIDA
jgi:internalin A